MSSQVLRSVLSAVLLASKSALVPWSVTIDLGCRCYVITDLCAVISMLLHRWRDGVIKILGRRVIKYFSGLLLKQLSFCIVSRNLDGSITTVWCDLPAGPKLSLCFWLVLCFNSESQQFCARPL